MQKVIEVKNLTKKFKELTAVNNLGLNVYRGDIFGFLGPNGAGKSTTIRMLMTLINPSSGSIKIFDKPLQQNRNEILRKVGAIVEKPDFYGYLSAYKNLEILGQISGCDTSNKRIMEILEIVGLEKRYKSKVKTFSHGMKQRLGLGQALLHNPELIILDEPTTGLHFDDIKKLLDILNRLVDAGNTVIVIEHNMDVIKTADWIIDLGPEGGEKGGKVVVTGTPEEIVKYHQESYTAKYLRNVIRKQ